MLYLDKADFILSQPPPSNNQKEKILKNRITNSFSLISFQEIIVHIVKIKTYF